MTALEYARQKVFFWQASPIAGVFNDSKYPIISDPLLELSNIFTKILTVYGPTQSLKTVFLQIACAYLLDIRRKSTLAVAQTDDDADDFSKIKLAPFLERIETLTETLKPGKSSKTLSNWLWAAHELIISGPGANAQQSKSVCYLLTDEAHQYCISNPGAMTALRDRMGTRWDRMEIHGTTAADAGTEVDILYHLGKQNEWHVRCIHCHELIWPLWIEASRKEYNGHHVFQWDENQSETAMMDSLRMVCPYCDKRITDSVRNRIDMDEGAQYVPKNPDADRQYQSFRWNAFAPRWKAWRDLFSIYLAAIASAKLGDFKPYENWVKKYEVRSWTGEFPLLGDSTRGRNYSIGDIKVIEPDELRVVSFDQQEGKSGEGFHLWAQCDTFKRNGDSKRVDYARLSTYDEAKAFQLRHQAKDENTAIDYGQGMREREIFAVCNRFHWLALKSTDEDEFAHAINKPGMATQIIRLPYSPQFLESATVGTKNQGSVVLPNSRIATVPKGFCIARLWSKPKMYPILYALKAGTAGREYGIARDINPVYVDQLHSYLPADALDKPTGTVRKIIWRKVAKDDHAFVTSAQNLVQAIVAGFYPLGAPIIETVTPK